MRLYQIIASSFDLQENFSHFYYSIHSLISKLCTQPPLKKRRLGYLTLAFLLGILFCQSLTELPDVRWSGLLFPLLIAIWLLPRYRLLFFFAIGFLWTVWRADMILAHSLPHHIEGQDIKIIGRVINLPKHRQYDRESVWQFDFAPLPFKAWPDPGHLRLSMSGDPPEPLRPGQLWQFTVGLKRVHGMINPGGFDYEGWSFRQRIQALGYVRPKGERRLLSEPSPFNIDNLRYRLALKIRDQLGDLPSTAIIIGLALGERQWITPEQKNVLQRTGTAHLIAISGLHIGFIVWLGFGVGRRLWCYASKATLWLPAPYFAALSSLLAAFIYALLAGFSLPTQRALIMVAVAVSSVVFARKVATSHLLTLALLIVLLWDPFAVLSAGFWLSYGAVATLIYALSGRREIGLSSLTKKGLGSWKMQWAVTLGLLAIVLAVFGYIPLISLPANSIAIPWVSFCVVPLTLLGTALILPLPEFGNGLLHIAADTISALWVSMEWFYNLNWNWQQHTPPLWTIIIAMIGVALLLLPRGFPGRWLGILWCLPLCFILPAHPNRGEVWLTLLDVGQGLAAVIRTQNNVLVYDTGPKSRSGFNTGDAVVVPFLRNKGIPKIDKLLISHGDNDHSGGTQSVLEQLQVNQVLTSAPEKIQKIVDNSRTKLSKTQVLSCQTGQHWHWDGIDFQILHPTAKSFSKKENNASCVLKVSVENRAILLPGDIEKSVEYRLVQNHLTDLIKANILIAPHHGSHTSSTERFLDRVQPTIALFSTGYRNRFKHPRKWIVQRYHNRHIQTWNTAQTGAISFRISAHEISAPYLARETMRRYWH